MVGVLVEVLVGVAVLLPPSDEQACRKSRANTTSMLHRILPDKRFRLFLMDEGYSNGDEGVNPEGQID